MNVHGDIVDNIEVWQKATTAKSIARVFWQATKDCGLDIASEGREAFRH